MINEQELKKKLAEWAGFEESHNRWHYEFTRKIMDWIFPDKQRVGKLPNFTESLDACFKWLVPKIEHFHYITFYIVRDAINEPQPIMWDSGICTYDHIQFARAKTPTLALCLAIEKLIDGEKGVIAANKKD